MKLEVSLVAQGARLATLTGLGSSGTYRLELPTCLLYTRCGSVPHLTHSTLTTLAHLPAVTQLPLATVSEHQVVLQSYLEGAAQFAGLRDTLLFCSLHDPAAPCPTGYNTNKTVSVWSSSGRVELNVQRYVSLLAAVRPDWYQSLCDGETRQSGVSRKRISKSVNRTLAHLDECLLLHHETQALRGARIFGVLEGSDVLDERLRSARETAKRPVDGFILDGFQSGTMEMKLSKELITAVTAELPQNKPRLVLGVGRPDEVCECVLAGVDLFEGFYPYQATERGSALFFNFSLERDPESTECEENGVEELPSVHTEDERKRFEMDLKDKRYREDLRPLVSGCTCYCCQKHTRAYVHHLLVTNEMLAGVLLMLHNLTHYCGFFSAVRSALATGRMQQLRKRILCGHGTH